MSKDRGFWRGDGVCKIAALVSTMYVFLYGWYHFCASSLAKKLRKIERTAQQNCTCKPSRPWGIQSAWIVVRFVWRFSLHVRVATATSTAQKLEPLFSAPPDEQFRLMGLDRPIELLPSQTSIVYRAIRMDFSLSLVQERSEPSSPSETLDPLRFLQSFFSRD